MNSIDTIARMLTENIKINNGLILEASWDPKLANHFFKDREIQKWLIQHEIDPSYYEEIGEGGIGRTYKFDEKAIKITPDERETRISKIASRKCDHQNLIKIYDVKEIPGTYKDLIGRNRTFFMILMDAVTIKPLKGTPLGKAADMVGGYLDVSGDRPSFNPAMIAQEVIKYQDDEVKPEEQKYILMLLEIVQDIYAHCGLRYVDVGETNIGFKDGKIVLFDLGLSEIT